MKLLKMAFPLVLLTTLLSACGSNPGKPPAGVVAQQRMAAKGGLASQPGGTCKVVSVSILKAGFNGSFGEPVPDTLTPGLDRCTWTITASNVGDTIRLTSYRLTSPPSVSKTGTTLVAVPQLGKGATWSATGFDLIFPYGNGALGLQIIAPVASKVDAKIALQDLIQVAATLKAEPGAGPAHTN